MSIEDQPAPTGEGLLVFPRFLNFFINRVGADAAAEEQVIQDIVDRALIGRERYGTFLRTENGRDARIDAYQELIDLCMYLMQLILEEPEGPGKDAMRAVLTTHAKLLVSFRAAFL